MDPVPLGYGQHHHRPRVNWMYETEPDPVPRPPVVLAARKSAGRLVVHQRAAVRARPGRGFRPLAAARQCGLGVRGRAAVFPSQRAAHRAGLRRAARSRRSAAVCDIATRTRSARPICRRRPNSASPAPPTTTAATQEGVAYYQARVRNGRRCSAAVASSPGDGAAEPLVVTRAQAERVIFEARRAVGVVYGAAGQRVTARARREVILCGGVTSVCPIP